ncbi:MAG: carboxypeptidase-like regulatory domain-containing protein [Paludibacteraceae bacterium]|nr:carboxypeptidase-like regulatory domain-containing protein [Paludibacteraceae bacterium]MBP6284094.1 carboxypeptidase-like regulatory domain-containing protein [Paludibacteraceae bacterium]
MKKVILPIVMLLSIFVAISVIQAKLIENRTVNISEKVQTINGIVADPELNESIAGAVISVNGQKTYSDLDGNFSFAKLDNKKCNVTISMISYETQTFEMDLASNQDLAIYLKKL